MWQRKAGQGDDNRRLFVRWVTRNSTTPPRRLAAILGGGVGLGQRSSLATFECHAHMLAVVEKLVPLHDGSSLLL